MSPLRMLAWSLRLDLKLLFEVKNLSFPAKLSLVVKKYLRYLLRPLIRRGSSPESLMVFGKRFCYDEALAVGALQRVYCAAHELQELLPERPVVLDVGANIGQFNFFATNYLRARRVVSIEPVRRSFELLVQNAVVASDSICCAVSDREGDVLFHVAQESTQLSSYLTQPDAAYRERYPVPARTLDRIADELGVGEVDLLKVDTEGTEFDVLKSAEKLLMRTEYVLVEMSIFRECSGNLFQVGNFLEDHGFSLVHLSAVAGGRPQDVDALFRRS